MVENYAVVGQAVGGTFAALLVSAYPLMKLVRMWSADRKDNAKDGAESILYQHLSNQVTVLNEELTKFRNENSTLLVEVSALRGKVSHFEDVFALNARLKLKLDARELENTRLKIRVEELNSQLINVCNVTGCHQRVKSTIDEIKAIVEDDHDEL